MFIETLISQAATGALAVGLVVLAAVLVTFAALYALELIRMVWSYLRRQPNREKNSGQGVSVQRFPRRRKASKRSISPVRGQCPLLAFTTFRDVLAKLSFEKMTVSAHSEGEPQGAEGWELFLEQVAGCGEPLLIASIYNNIGCEYAAEGRLHSAIKMFERAWQELEDAGVPAETTMAEAILDSLKALAALGVGGRAAGEVDRLYAFLSTVRHPVFRRPALDIITCNLEAARIRTLAPEGIALFEQAAESFADNQYDLAACQLEESCSALEERLARTDLRWPVAAAQHDLAVCRNFAGGNLEDVFQPLETARELLGRSAAPGNWLRALVHSSHKSFATTCASRR